MQPTADEEPVAALGKKLAKDAALAGGGGGENTMEVALHNAEAYTGTAGERSSDRRHDRRSAWKALGGIVGCCAAACFPHPPATSPNRRPS
ncbi:hypothetical protein E2562_001789 [Oryza meyeriana var. granulata]|uniref:Uncharacterized protein n=1 Tax=Oryza meyeriana var. granulata TaxID=110450 RepID=A0A6G1CDL3_9ORYZ|nr:hypothetical protein E2562_001789 [Oryza meyeriana var. granulata]